MPQYPLNTINSDRAYRAITANNSTITSADTAILISPTAAWVTNLPKAAERKGQLLTLRIRATVVSTVTLTAATGEFIENANTLVVNSNGSIVLQSNGSTGWEIISSNINIPGPNGTVEERSVTMTADDVPALSALTSNKTAIYITADGDYFTILPTAEQGDEVTIVNISAANTVEVRPAGADTINMALVNPVLAAAAAGLPESVTLLRTSATNWTITS